MTEAFVTILSDFLTSTNDETFYSGIPLLGRYPEKTVIQKNKCVPVFIAALFTIARTWKEPKYPLTEKCIKKLRYIYTMEYH